jgi:hypothetical protein
MAQPQQQKKTFRFEFESEIMELIKRFAIVHQYDERKMYKEQWNIWYNENKEDMEREIERMNDIGYVGDVKDKMYKAGRYYFRKKNIKKEDKEETRESELINNIHTKNATNIVTTKNATSTTSTTNTTNTEKKRRNYITMLEATLVAMDEHIKTSLANDVEFKPSDGYSEFCEKNILVLRTEIQRMVVDNIMDKKDIAEKIKKTYKNRYFMITRN